MRAMWLAAAVGLAATVACGSTHVTNITVVSDAGVTPGTATDAGDGASEPVADASTDVDVDTDASVTDGGDAGPQVCTGGNDPSSVVSDDCIAPNPCPFDFCGPTGVAYVCGISASDRPPIDGCRKGDNGLHCCLPACVRASSLDGQCGSHAYSCPPDKDGNPSVTPPDGCNRKLPTGPGYGYVCCLD